MSWTAICSADELVENSGVCVLFNTKQVAVFLVRDSDEALLYAIGNYDPAGDANVLSRGIIGSVNGQTVVASPLYKHHFDLNTGHCLELPELQIPAYDVKLQHGQLWLKLQAEQAASAA